MNVWPALVSALLLVLSGGETNTLVPLFAIGVIIGFTLCQGGTVRHRSRERPSGRLAASVVAVGSVLTTPCALMHPSVFTRVISVRLWPAVPFANFAEAVERIPDPLGMKETGIHVPADRIDRLPPVYPPPIRGPKSAPR